ncbi:GNAT family N-acetyltransferase [Botryobacter ruber]|uniref:GNAT family N-acetyltransferase n=1 Tax=Botryobacter ruber TaxID=2171629 RepID=UPI000E0A5116|nr:GNAT family N-acetyltransferase [Botryobacter ruber]
MFLKSDKIYLRALEPTDLDFLYELENDVSVWHVGNTVAPYSRFVLEQYLENAALDIYTVRQLRLLICTPDHQPVGAIDLFDFEPLHCRAGIGIMLAPAFRRQGYASESLSLLLDYCRQTLLLHQVYCSVTASNHTSRQLFEQAGFQEVGLRKEWLRTAAGWDDVVEYQKLF